MENIKVFALGGLDENGKNCYCLEIENDIFVIEAGVKFPDKLTPGIDYIIARFDYLYANRDRVRGYFISHGHNQILGALPYFYRKVPAPVYCTEVTRCMIEGFMEHNHLNFPIEFKTVKSGDTIYVAGREISFFGLSHNMPQTVGMAFATEHGNILYASPCIVNNNIEFSFSSERQHLVNILHKRNTLLLMATSKQADNPGYTAPKHDISLLAEPTFKNAKGRIFVGVLTPDIYSIYKIMLLAMKYNRRIIAYDDETMAVFEDICKSTKYALPNKFEGHRDEVGRYRPQEVCVIMTAFGTHLYSQVCLLANGQNDDKRFKLNETDTFIYGSSADNSTEIAYTESLDELYKANVNVVYFKKSNFLKMNPSQEDIKYIINLTKPKYYFPVNGMYQKLIANAMLAVSMNCGLNFSNVFVLDNGNVLSIQNGLARLSKETVITGDLFVDGTGLGKGNTTIMSERMQLGDNGIVIISAGFSKQFRNITFGPDVQSKGFVHTGNAEQVTKDIKKLFTQTIYEEIRKPNYNLEYVKESSKDVIFRYIRRATQRTPIIIISLFELE